MRCPGPLFSVVQRISKRSALPGLFRMYHTARGDLAQYPLSLSTMARSIPGYFSLSHHLEFLRNVARLGSFCLLFGLLDFTAALGSSRARVDKENFLWYINYMTASACNTKHSSMGQMMSVNQETSAKHVPIRFHQEPKCTLIELF